MKPWTVRSSTITYEDEWLRIRSDSCVRSDGRVIEPFHIIESSEWVCVLALTDGGDVVTIREYRHGAGSITIGLPGGLAEDHDDHFEQSARRELEEETGYTCDTLVPTGRAFANWANQNNQISYFLGFGARPSGTANLDPNEEIEPVLMPYETFADYEFDTRQQTHHAAALFYAERYFRRNPDKRPKTG